MRGEGTMDALAVTYRTSNRASDLRTVIVTDATRSVVLLPAGRMEILRGTHAHGKSCACAFWAEALDLDIADDTFAVPSTAVVQTRPLPNVKSRKAWHK
jgi:hypothetical protein